MKMHKTYSVNFFKVRGHMISISQATLTTIDLLVHKMTCMYQSLTADNQLVEK